MKIATLGPPGTFSHEAVLTFDNKADIIFKSTIRDIFEDVKLGAADFGVVPIENSVSGSIGFSLDALIDFDLSITAEEVMLVKHCLAGNCSLQEIKKIYVHPQTHAQCENFIRENLPGAEIIETSSNSRSAELLKESKDKYDAAITSIIAIELFGLNLVKSNIQDNRFNVTRFVKIGGKIPEKTGRDKTSVAIYPIADRPGLLYEILGEFNKQDINLTKIESRPSKNKLGDYIFYIDFENHISEEHVKYALNEIEQKSAYLKVLGSYPRKF